MGIELAENQIAPVAESLKDLRAKAGKPKYVGYSMKTCWGGSRAHEDSGY